MNNIIGLYRRRMMMSALGSGIDVAALSITYTGAYTDYGMVTMSGGARYRLLAFTSSGTFSIDQPVNCEVCVVGGGANGSRVGSGNGGGTYGGAGAYLKNQFVPAYNGGSVVIGAGQGVSSIANVSVNAVLNQHGGSGAGGLVAGTGDGISKYPFEDMSYSLWAGKPHCAGGGAGGWSRRDGSGGWDSNSYGDGGSNGSNGSSQTSQGTENAPGGSGGLYGGGNGGNAIHLQCNGANATYYGSGGGGGAYYHNYSEEIGNVGSGYQGIVYIRIPEEQATDISDLPLGALINVGTDGGAGTPNYEIADKDNLVSGGVVLVRKDIYSNSQFGSTTSYPNSTLDNLIKTTIYNEMPQQLRDKMMDVTFNLSGSGDITRKMFAPTYTMMSFGKNNGVTEGKVLQLYKSSANRVKTLNGSTNLWWLSSQYSSTNVRAIRLNGYNDRREPSSSLGVVPAFVISSKTSYDLTPNPDGSYNLIL